MGEETGAQVKLGVNGHAGLGPLQLSLEVTLSLCWDMALPKDSPKHCPLVSGVMVSKIHSQFPLSLIRAGEIGQTGTVMPIYR